MKVLLTVLICLLSVVSYAQRFTSIERDLITSGDTSAMLRVIPLSEPAGEKALKATSVDIDWKDPLLPLLKNRMYKAVLDSNNAGVGIAAPQVGINRNLIWVKRFDKAGEPFEFFINPKIVWRSKLLRQGMEGDLSFADKRGDVVRNYTIMVSYTDINGVQHLEHIEDFTAVIFQHETDHLFGILLTDRLEQQKNEHYRVYFSPRKSNLLLQER